MIPQIHRPRLHRRHLAAARLVAPMPYRLMGMFMAIGAESDQSEPLIQDDSEVIQVARNTEFNAGIGIVLPIQLVRDLLCSERMEEFRRQQIARRKQHFGAPSASAAADERMAKAEPLVHSRGIRRLLELMKKSRSE
jgi:hypothetical protein